MLDSSHLRIERLSPTKWIKFRMQLEVENWYWYYLLSSAGFKGQRHWSTGTTAKTCLLMPWRLTHLLSSVFLWITVHRLCNIKSDFKVPPDNVFVWPPNSQTHWSLSASWLLIGLYQDLHRTHNLYILTHAFGYLSILLIPIQYPLCLAHKALKGVSLIQLLSTTISYDNRGSRKDQFNRSGQFQVVKCLNHYISLIKYISVEESSIGKFKEKTVLKV